MFKSLLKNLRHGFATNSSSSHSFVYMKTANSEFGVMPTSPEEYGWDDFRLDTIAEKLFYVFVQRVSSLHWQSPAKKEESIEKLAGDFPEFGEAEFDLARESYVDHESVGTVSVQDARDPHVVIFGGNDNDGCSRERSESIRDAEVDWSRTTPKYEDISTLEEMKSNREAQNVLKKMKSRGYYSY